jgi:cytochrome c peroxidase
LYADSGYHNIAVPYNREIKQTVLDEKGKVVANGVTVAPQEKKGLSQHVGGLGGVFKTPTLRNVDKGATWSFVKAYMHNGYFKNLEDVVHFYNTRSVLAKCEDQGIPNATAAEAKKNNCWPVAEFPVGSAAPAILGNLGLTESEEAALVAYMKTLSDSTTAKAP